MKIIYTRPDGGISVISPAPQNEVAMVTPEVAVMTEEQYIDWIKNKDVPADAENIQIVGDDYVLGA